MTYRVTLFLLAATLLITASCRLVMAQGGCATPTITDEVAIPSDWPEWPEWHGRLEIHSEMETIARNEGIDLWSVVEGGNPCPPFTWTVSGTGFYFGSISGPTTATTQEEFEILELWADSTACGSAWITVTDACGQRAEGSVRSTAGKWVQIEHIMLNCGNTNCCVCGDTVTLGGQRWRTRWGAGPHPCNNPYERCGDPYPINTFPGSCIISQGGYFRPPAGTPCCFYVGFEPCFAIREDRPYDKTYWEWRCP